LIGLQRVGPVWVVGRGRCLNAHSELLQVQLPQLIEYMLVSNQVSLRLLASLVAYLVDMFVCWWHGWPLIVLLLSWRRVLFVHWQGQCCQVNFPLILPLILIVVLL
jgi:hypothetical protein